MSLNIPAVIAAWQNLDRVAHDALAPLKEEAGYQRALKALDELLRVVGEDENHPLGDLTESLMHRVMAYEAEHHPVPPPAQT